MGVVEDSILIRCTPEEAFDLSQDYALRLRWDPFLADLKLLDGATATAVGVRTWVKSKGGIEMVAEYVAVDRPRVVAIAMVEGAPDASRATRMFEQFGGSWRFKDVGGVGNGTTLVTMRYTFAIKRGVLRWAQDQAACLVFGRDVRERLRGLKRGVEEMGLVEEMRRGVERRRGEQVGR